MTDTMIAQLYDKKYALKKKYFPTKISDHFLHKKVLKCLNPEKDECIIDIGCNTGSLVKLVRPFCKRAVGIDINKDAIGSSNCSELYHMDATNLGFPENSFDKIVSLHTIEHIPDLKKAFQEMDRVLKPGGRVVLAYPLEVVRGMTTFAFLLFVVNKNIFEARKIMSTCRKMHVHKLDKKAINRFIRGTNLQIKEHSINFFWIWPIFMTVLTKK